jgi:hypothetical protein
MAKTGLLPDLDRLNEVFEYDPENGNLIWKAKPHPKAHAVIIGAPSGSMCERGYINVMLDCKPYGVHRIVWKMHYKVEPPEFIDHENGNQWDFKINNLRPATQSQNNANRKVMANSKSGIKGIKNYSNGQYNCWLASFSVNGKKKAKSFPYNDDGLNKAIEWRNFNCSLINGEYDKPSENIYGKSM